jgi:hypothetical protein
MFMLVPPKSSVRQNATDRGFRRNEHENMIRLKKREWEMRDCPWRAASWRHNCTGTGYSSTVLFWLFREINGDKVATILVFKSADN